MRTYSRQSVVGTHQRQERREGRNKGVKRLKKKELRLRAKPSAPTPAVDALIGDEELTGEKRREKIERNRE